MAERIVIQGVRAGPESAERRRREAAGIVDAVVAADLQQLPDLSVADAVQRITGVQVTRDRGEASTFAVRGLTQVQTTLNGREIFTAGSGRTLDLADIPVELIQGIDVHKTSAASLLEGGLGATVDLRTRRPLDLRGDITVLSARAIHGDAAGRTAGQGSVLLSRRSGEGRGTGFGLLLHAVVQDRAWREDQWGTGNPIRRTDVLPGQTVDVANGASLSLSDGLRQRRAGSVVAQWRPDPATTWLAEAHLAELRTLQDTRQVNISAGTGVQSGSVELFGGSSTVRRITWTDAPVSILGFARDTVDRTRQLALGVQHEAGDWTFEADASHVRSINRLAFAGPFLATRAATFTHDLSGAVPQASVGGSALLDPAAYAYTGVAYRLRPFLGELSALKLEATWHPAAGPVEDLRLGWRHAVRRAHNAPGLIFGDAALAGLDGTDTPGRLAPLMLADALGGRLHGLPAVLMPVLDDVRDPVALRAALGLTAALPVAGSALGVWRLRERSDALHLQADWAAPGGALDGQVGVRLVSTRLEVDGAQAVPGSTPVPLAAAATTTDALPSAALRWRPGGTDTAVQWRAAVSRSIARPGFDQLSPSITLLPNSVNPALNSGSAGNPALRPVRSTNVDLAWESTGTRGAAWSATVFWKQVDGFVFNLSQPETWGGATYQITRPYNLDQGRLSGVELALLRTIDDPGSPWRGLGLQANYTCIDSSTVDRRLGRTVPLQNLSRHGLNLIGLAERGAWRARLAWNWRSSFLSGLNSIVGVGTLPVTTRAYGWLDASLGWTPAAGVLLSLEGGNLLRTLRTSYTGDATRPQTAWTNDRQWAVTASWSL